MQGEAMPTHSITVKDIVGVLSQYRYSFSSEEVLHRGMAEAFGNAGIPFMHEFVAGPEDRFDFLVDGIVVEAKIKRSMAPALIQCKRYAERADVRGVVLAATRFWAGAELPAELFGKPFAMVRLGMSF